MTEAQEHDRIPSSVMAVVEQICHPFLEACVGFVLKKALSVA